MITLEELTIRLLACQETQFVGLRAVHEPDWSITSKRNPFVGKVLKLSRANGAINWRYTRAVNRQRKREDKPEDFQAVERTWGNLIRYSPLVIHFDEGPQFYLEMKRERVERWYFDSSTLELIEESEILPYLTKRAKSRQKLNREVVLRDYRLDHIAELTINGETWQIDPCWWKLKALRFAYPTTPAAKKGTKS